MLGSGYVKWGPNQIFEAVIHIFEENNHIFEAANHICDKSDIIILFKVRSINKH
jgi:hypothetical protein